MKKIITFISDTHTKHQYCENDLPGGDILIHAGDFMNSGYHKKEVIEFLKLV
jgi:predicted phosphodiesterase